MNAAQEFARRLNQQMNDLGNSLKYYLCKPSSGWLKGDLLPVLIRDFPKMGRLTFAVIIMPRSALRAVSTIVSLLGLCDSITVMPYLLGEAALQVWPPYWIVRVSLGARISWVIAVRAAPMASLEILIPSHQKMRGGRCLLFPACSRLLARSVCLTYCWLVICLDTLAARAPMLVAPRRRLFTYTPVASAQLQRRRGGGGFGLFRLAAAGDSLARG